MSAVSVNSHRRSLGSKRTESHSMSSRPNMTAYFGPGGSTDQDVVEDNSHDEDVTQKNKNRNRRASEGSHLIKGESKKSGDLRCDTCGKGYKHSSCLTKHMYVDATDLPERLANPHPGGSMTQHGLSPPSSSSRNISKSSYWKLLRFCAT